MKFVICIPSYNNEKWCEQNIISAITQKHKSFRIIVTDDCSTDKTKDIISSVVKNVSNVTFIRNSERLGAMANIHKMYHMCEDTEIIVHLDGDDWLAHPNVLERVEGEYAKGSWVTYGQYVTFPDGMLGCSAEIPSQVIERGSFRNYKWCSSHLRTFYAKLAKLVHKRDCMTGNRKFYQMAADLAIMFPILEMAGEHQSFISDVLYVYNCATDLNDSKVNLKLQQHLELVIRTQHRYRKLISLESV